MFQIGTSTELVTFLVADGLATFVILGCDFFIDTWKRSSPDWPSWKCTAEQWFTSLENQ